MTAEAASRGVRLTIVIDFVHVLEYLWKAAWSFFDKGERAAEEWVADQARKILRGKARQVAAGIRRHHLQLLARGARRRRRMRPLPHRQAPFLDYPKALREGWPIATGVIEGACRLYRFKTHRVVPDLGLHEITRPPERISSRPLTHSWPQVWCSGVLIRRSGSCVTQASWERRWSLPALPRAVVGTK